jgi:hypothetical protein
LLCISVYQYINICCHEEAALFLCYGMGNIYIILCMLDDFINLYYFPLQSTAEILLNIHGEGWSDDTAVAVDHGPPDHSLNQCFSIEDTTSNTRELFEVLQESTRTALLVQVLISE